MRVLIHTLNTMMEGSNGIDRAALFRTYKCDLLVLGFQEMARPPASLKNGSDKEGFLLATSSLRGVGKESFKMKNWLKGKGSRGLYTFVYARTNKIFDTVRKVEIKKHVFNKCLTQNKSTWLRVLSRSKGYINVTVTLKTGRKISFINTHLPFERTRPDTGLSDRLRCLKQIARRECAKSHICFLFGDLNFRTTDAAVKLPYPFREGKIRFRHTCKMRVPRKRGAYAYDDSRPRGHCDRVLFSRKDLLTVLKYASVDVHGRTDHRAVYGLFRVENKKSEARVETR